MKPPFKAGDRIELVSMPHDPDPIRPGTQGVVDSVAVHDWPHGTFASVGVRWDNGRTLGIVMPPDDARLVEPAPVVAPASQRRQHMAHQDLPHGATCPDCYWTRPSAADEHNDRIRRETEEAIDRHPNTRRY